MNVFSPGEQGLEIILGDVMHLVVARAEIEAHPGADSQLFLGEDAEIVRPFALVGAERAALIVRRQVVEEDRAILIGLVHADAQDAARRSR